MAASLRRRVGSKSSTRAHASQGAQFSLDDVEVVTATVDLDDVRAKRCANVSRSFQACRLHTVPHY